MRQYLLVQCVLEGDEVRVELLRLNDRPRNDVKSACVELGNEVRILFLVDDLL